MTQTQTPPAGWYPDPAGSGGQRWWNGMAWSDHVQPAVAAPVPVQTPAVAATAPAAAAATTTVVPGAVPVQSHQDATAAAQHAPSAEAAGLTVTQAAQYTPMGTVVPGAGEGPSAPGSLGHAWAPMTTSMSGSRSDNQFAYITFGFAAFYILLAVMTHFVLIGVVPILMAVRSLNAREKLAPYAMGVAILTVVISFMTLSGH
jgi:hypothetical protein